MASKAVINTIKMDVAGKRVPKFKAGSELASKVNAIFIETDVTDGDLTDVEFSIQFEVHSTIEE